MLMTKHRCPRCGNRTSEHEREVVRRAVSGTLLWRTADDLDLHADGFRKGASGEDFCPACLTFALADIA